MATALIGSASVVGVSLGASDAHAKIEPAQYKYKQQLYGVIPTPDSNARVVGNRLYSDYFGAGRWNMYNYKIAPTRHGGSFGSTPGPVGSWIGHTEFTKSRNGYQGVIYAWGQIPVGTAQLQKAPGPRR